MGEASNKRDTVRFGLFVWKRNRWDGSEKHELAHEHMDMGGCSLFLLVSLDCALCVPISLAHNAYSLSHTHLGRCYKEKEGERSAHTHTHSAASCICHDRSSSVPARVKSQQRTQLIWS